MFTTRFEAWVRRRAEALMSAIGRVLLGGKMPSELMRP